MMPFHLFGEISSSSSKTTSSTTSSKDSDEPEPYDKEKIPLWLRDLRRFEIVSLGSVPFALLPTTVAYGAYLKSQGERGHVPGPLSQSSFDEWQQVKLMGITVGVGLCIGTVDFAVNQIVRHSRNKRQKRINLKEQVIVIPFSENSSPETIIDEATEIETIESDDNGIEDIEGIENIDDTISGPEQR
ncbi:MAG: hypothetical protein MJZ50_03440 [Treponema sp.]|nr:hypothetical protein [Treponema sp.]